MKVAASDGVKVLSTFRDYLLFWRDPVQRDEQVQPASTMQAVKGTGLAANRSCACLQVYNVSSGKSVPEWLSEGKKKSLKKDEEYR